MISIILLTSCMSTQNIKTDIPDPIVDGESVIKIDLSIEIVSMPYWYWKKIVECFIEVEENIK